MNKTFLLAAIIFAAINLIPAQTWDILDKPMSAWNVNGGATTNQAWAVAQGSSAGSIATQQAGYVNFTKTNAGSTARWAWVRPATALANLTTGTPYSIEVKARVHSTGIADNATNFEANQISLRLGGKNTAARFYLRYGDGVTGGSVNTVPGTSGAYRVNTSAWQVYRLVFHADHTKYDVYLAGVDAPVFEGVAVSTTGDQNGIYFGAESTHRCNMDVEYVKMGTGDFFSTAKIVSVSLSSNSQVENTGKTIAVTVRTVEIADGAKIQISLVDGYGNVLVDGVEADVANDKATANLTVPATLATGKYLVKAATPGGKIGEATVSPKTAEYFVCLANKLPDWAFGGFVRPEGKNPVIKPDATSVFFCPMNQADVKWEESDTFNPAAVVKDGKICVLYRAEDNSATGIGKRVSRVAMAETTDGVTMKTFGARVLSRQRQFQ